MKLLVILVLVCSLAASASPIVNNFGRSWISVGDIRRAGPSARRSASTTTTGAPTGAPTAAPTAGSGSTAGASGSASASGSSTPAPTAIAGSTRIVQVATVNAPSLANAAAYTGATKVLFERAYGKMLGICANTACSSYKAGGHVTSVASDTAFRRGTVFIQFTSTVAPADAAAAQTAATAFTTATGQQNFVTGMAAIKAADTAQFGGVTVPTAAQVTGLAPTLTIVGASGNTSSGGGGSTSGSEKKSVAGWCLAVALGVLALRQ